jgi:hypothetical protein
MNYLSPSPLLRATLTIDAAASGTLALLQLLAPYAIAQFTGLAVELLLTVACSCRVRGVVIGWPPAPPWRARWPNSSSSATSAGRWRASSLRPRCAAIYPHSALGYLWIADRADAGSDRTTASSYAIEPGVASNREFRLEIPALTEEQ